MIFGAGLADRVGLDLENVLEFLRAPAIDGSDLKNFNIFMQISDRLDLDTQKLNEIVELINSDNDLEKLKALRQIHELAVDKDAADELAGLIGKLNFGEDNEWLAVFMESNFATMQNLLDLTLTVLPAAGTSQDFSLTTMIDMIIHKDEFVSALQNIDLSKIPADVDIARIGITGISVEQLKKAQAYVKDENFIAELRNFFTQIDPEHKDRIDQIVISYLEGREVSAEDKTFLNNQYYAQISNLMESIKTSTSLPQEVRDQAEEALAELNSGKAEFCRNNSTICDFAMDADEFFSGFFSGRPASSTAQSVTQ